MHFFTSVEPGGLSLFDRLRVMTRIVGALLVWAPVWLFAAWAVAGFWQRMLIAVSLPIAALIAGADSYDVVVRFQHANVIADGFLLTQFALFSALGVLLSVAFIALPLGVRDGAPSGEARFALLLWIIVAAAFNLLATSAVAFGAVRHLLAVFVPLVLLGGGAFDRASEGRGVLRCFAGLSLAAGMGLGGLLAHGDRLAATAGVQIADEVAVLVADGSQVWAPGDPALRYYIEQAGGRWWRGDPKDVPVGGIVAMLYSRTLGYRLHPMLGGQCRLVGRTTLESWNPLRTQTAYASFYAGNVLTLPWMTETSPKARGPKGGWDYDDILIYRRVR
jgi:hypothetical protein